MTSINKHFKKKAKSSLKQVVDDESISDEELQDDD